MQKKINIILVLFILILQSCKQKVENETSNILPDKKDDLVALNKAIADDPKNAANYFHRSKIFLNKKNITQSFEDISKAVLLDSMKAEYYLLLADVSFKGMQIQKSIESFKKAIVLDPKNKEPHLKLSELYLYLKAYPLCLEQANEALKIDKHIAKAYFIKGFAYKETGDTSKALSSFQTAVEAEGNYYDAFMQLGNIYAAQKNSIALQYYNSALRIQPSSLEALYNRGFLYQNRGEYDKAISDYQAILKADKRYAEAHFNLGFIDVAFKNDYNSAIKHFTNAILSNDQYAEAFYNRGVCHELAGDKKAAISDYKKSVGIFPTYQLALDKLKQK